MSKKKNKEQEELRQSAQAAGQAEKKADIESKEETPAVDKEAKEIEEKLAKLLKENEELKASVAKEKDDYVRLMADFENFRRHSEAGACVLRFCGHDQRPASGSG